MNLYINITDENDYLLDRIEIYQDGSDSEGSNKIRELIEEHFDIADEIEFL